MKTCTTTEAKRERVCGRKDFKGRNRRVGMGERKKGSLWERGTPNQIEHR
jgi:hypothetical protein